MEKCRRNSGGIFGFDKNSIFIMGITEKVRKIRHFLHMKF